MQALGLIEVIGYPPAVEAADAALKAANVTLLSIAKADAGIMTVEIIGDVGAVTSAVDAGARSAARIGIVRARHVIPKVEADLIGKVIPRERTSIKEDPINIEQGSFGDFERITTGNNDSTPQATKNETKIDTSFVADREINDNGKIKSKLDLESEIKQDNKSNTDTELKKEVKAVTKPNVEDNKNQENLETSLTVDQLNKRSNANLKALIKSRGISISDKRLNEMKKQELIRLILGKQ